MSTQEKIVLIAMDGSSYCNYAFDWYMENVHRQTDKVILFNCVELQTITAMPMGIGSAALITRVIDESKVHADHYLKTLTDKMKAANLHGTVKQVHGSPRTELIRVAEEEKVTFIVTGTRGMGTVRRTLLGSVSDYVIHHAHVPVIICRHKDDHHKHGYHADPKEEKSEDERL